MIKFAKRQRLSMGVGLPRVMAASVAVLALVGTPELALGQAVSPAAGAPTRDELRGVTEKPAPQAPRLTVAGDIERSPCPLADPQFQSVNVTISAVTFNNLKGATAEELAPAWSAFAGTPQPVAVICEIRDAAATILRNKGYLAAVQVPVQRIENGQVRLEVLYARVTAIRARGETRGAERKLEEYLGHIAEDEIFDRFKAERYLLLARDLPGYDIQLTMKPAGTAPGDLIGEVTVVHRPYAVDLTVQNLASGATGRWGGQLRAQAFGLTGMGDATSLSYYATSDFSEQHIAQASHEFRPGSEGLTVGGQLTYAWTKPDLGTASAPGTALTARTLYASLYARYPIRRTQGENLWAGGGLDLVNQDVDLIGPLSRDRLRVAWARLDFDAIDLKNRLPEWRVASSLELRQGLAVLDASRNCIGAGCPPGAVGSSRLDGSPSATVIRFQSEAEVRRGRISFVLAPRGQYAFKPLLSFEEFSAGSYTVGRGYDPGALLGDSGIGITGELRGPRIALADAGTIRIQPYAFGDAAWTWNKGIPGSENLLSVGGGIRAEFKDRFRLDASLAVPTKRTGLQTRRGDTRFLLTLTTRILPWRTN